MPSLDQDLVFGPRSQWKGNCILWIGRAMLPPGLQKDLPGAFGLGHGRVIPVPLRELDAVRLAELSPRGSASALFWSEGDVIDAARRLASLGYRGPYRALSPALPNAEVIVREVVALFPGIDFSVIEISPHLLLQQDKEP